MNWKNSSRKSRITFLALVLIVGFAAAAAGTVFSNPVKALELVELQRLIRESEGPLLIVFMAAWCHPCIRELPDLERLYQEYRKHGLDVIGISLDLEGPQAMQPVIDRLKVQFPVYWVGETGIEAFQIRGIPLLMLVRGGEVVERIVGQRSADFLEVRIEALLRGAPFGTDE